MSDKPIANLRLLRIAEEICSCVLTDGFCGPKYRPDCRCWIAARVAVRGLMHQADPCLEQAFASYSSISTEARRSIVESLGRAILERRDELTAEHERRAEDA